MADMIVLILIIGYCGFVIFQRHRQKKNGTQNGCRGICDGCSGCGDLSHLKETYFADKMKKKGNYRWVIQQVQCFICSSL